LIHVTYDPYGNVVACTAATVTINGTNKCTGTSIGVVSLMYTGQYRDDESNLYYLRARTLDPATGGFLERDPMVAVTRSPYAYVSGNPLNMTDLTGLGNDPPVPVQPFVPGTPWLYISQQGFRFITVTGVAYPTSGPTVKVTYYHDSQYAGSDSHPTKGGITGLSGSITCQPGVWYATAQGPGVNLRSAAIDVTSCSAPPEPQPFEWPDWITVPAACLGIAAAAAAAIPAAIEQILSPRQLT
jgi:RHS repeat-associated protein